MREPGQTASEKPADLEHPPNEVDGEDAQHKSAEYGEYYYRHYDVRPYSRDPSWRATFDKLAERIIGDLEPETVLDAGCALGMLVEALRERGVEAWGVDISEYAIERVAADVESYCWQGSLTEPLPRSYDLITSIEVVEHMPSGESELAVENMCAAADRILFSSSPDEYGEVSHVNVQPQEHWSALFAKHGFIRNHDFDASFVIWWAALYERSDRPLHEVVRAYDRSWSRLRNEVIALRETALRQEQQLELYSGVDDGDQGVVVPDGDLQLQQAYLAGRDAIVVTEARLGDALGKLAMLEEEVQRYQRDSVRLSEILGSRTWRYSLGLYHALRRRLRGER